MINNLEFFMALKQLRAKPWQSVLAILSVAVGVLILICALSLTNGFEKDLVDKIMGTNPHISVEPALIDRIGNYNSLAHILKERDGVKTVSPMIRGQGLLNNKREARGILVYGVENNPEDLSTADWRNYLKNGDLPERDGIVLGQALANRLGLQIGDTVDLITGVGLTSTLKVTGIFLADFYEIDSRIGLISLAQAQELFNLPMAVNFISIKLNDPFQAQDIAKEIQNDYFTFSVRSWLSDNRGLLAAMQTEKKVIFIVMMFIIIVAMLGMANLLVMIVLEKTVEISILRAIGASKNTISKLFLYQGMLIGLSGIALGNIGGYLGSLLLSLYPINLPSDVYIIGKLPVEMQWPDFAMVSGAAFLVCLFASLVPARRAVRLKPLEAIRRTN